MADDEKSAMYERGAETMRAIGNANPGPGTARYPALPPEQAKDVQRKLVEFDAPSTDSRPFPCWPVPNRTSLYETRGGSLLRVRVFCANRGHRLLHSLHLADTVALAAGSAARAADSGIMATATLSPT